MIETTEVEPRKAEITLKLAYIGGMMIIAPMIISTFTNMNENIGFTLIILGSILILPRVWVRRKEINQAISQFAKAFLD